MAPRHQPRTRIELTRLGAWIIGIATVPILVFGVATAVSMWSTTQDELGARIFLIVWLVLYVGFSLNILRVCLRRTAMLWIPPGIRLDLHTPLFWITPVDDRQDAMSR